MRPAHAWLDAWTAPFEHGHRNWTGSWLQHQGFSTQGFAFQQGHPHRNRQFWPDRGRRRPLLGRADRTFTAEFPHRSGPDADADHPRAGDRQACGGRNQSRTRPARPPPRRRHCACRARGDRRQARRSLSPGGVADRLRHANQHEPQRGDLQPRQRTARRRTWDQEAGSSQRPCQYEPVIERLVPDRDAHRRGRADHCRSHSGAERASRRFAQKRKGVRKDRKNRADPHPGCHATDARPGIFRLCMPRSRAVSRGCAPR